VTTLPIRDGGAACARSARVRYEPKTRWSTSRQAAGSLARSRRDAAVFGEFYDRMSPSVQRFFARRTWDGQLSLELTAETFAKAFEKRHDFRGHDDIQAASWLWTIARNELKAHWRARSARLNATVRASAEHAHSADDEILRVEELEVANAARGALEDALRSLPGDQRRVIEMRVLQELSYEEIAKRIGVSGQVARARVSRGLRQLGRSQALREQVR
jgi:RNA polymerase sigma-70 factor (ECF subfamily)